MIPRKTLVSLLLAALSSAAASAQQTIPNLRDLADVRGKKIGTDFSKLICTSADNHTSRAGWESTYDTELKTLKKHFHIASAGWQMFPGHSWRGPDTLCYHGINDFIDWAGNNNVQVAFHGLGYIQRATWPQTRKDLYDTPEKAATFTDVTYQNYLDHFLNNFGGRPQVVAWDVMNEHISPGSYSSTGWDLSLSYLTAWGGGDAKDPDKPKGKQMYVQTLTNARQKAPNATLVYLDYNNEIICPKANTQYSAVRESLVPTTGPKLIDAVGFQLHLNTVFNRQYKTDAGVLKTWHSLTDSQYIDRLRENIQRYADLGLQVWTTEAEVEPATPDMTPPGDGLSFDDRQAWVFRKMVEVCLEFPNYPTFKLWGTLDTSTRKARLFTPTGDPRPAFWTVADALQTYKPTDLYYQNFSATPAGWTFLGNAVVERPSAGAPGWVKLPAPVGNTVSSGAVNLPVGNSYNPFLSYRWDWTATPPVDLAVIVEVNVPDANGVMVWREVKRHDRAEFDLRKDERVKPVAGFCTLANVPATTRVRFRHVNLTGATLTNPPAFKVSEIKLRGDNPAN